MTHTKKAAAVRKAMDNGAAAQKAQKAEEAPKAPIVVITPAEELVPFPEDKKQPQTEPQTEQQQQQKQQEQEPQPVTDDQKEDGTPKKPTAAEMTAARQAWLAGTKRVAADMKAEAVSLSGLCRTLWEYCKEQDEDTEAKKALRAKAAKDIMAVGRLDVVNLSRKEFTREWLDICRTYADAHTKEGVAVTLKPVGAGLLKAVEWEPKMADIYDRVVSRWTKVAKAIKRVELGEYYQRGKGKGAPALVHLHKGTAEKHLSEYRARRDHGKAAGKEAEVAALTAYDARKAAEQAE